MTSAVVERRLPHVQRTLDCFGIADVLAVHPRERRVLLVQATTAGHVADRLQRIQGRAELPALLAAGVSIEVWGWTLRAGRWQVRIVQLQAEDLAGVEVEAPAPRPRRRPGTQGELFS